MQPDDKMQWMREAKLGMFIHWGHYAGPAEGEWYMYNRGILPDEYRKLAYPESGDQYFDARDYHPREWVALAQKMGARYMNLTTMHHDGFALFKSQAVNAFTAKQTLNRDLVKEYVEACREGGMRVGFYKTLINWRYPGYYDVTGTDCKKNNFGYTTAAWHKENARLMKEELYYQVRELMTNYGKIDQLFWDGGWIEQQPSDREGAAFWESYQYLDAGNPWPICPCFQDIEEATGQPLGLIGMVRHYQPDILMNPRSGWIGDYTCEEGDDEVKGEIRPGVTEKCLSLIKTWGYHTMAEDPDNVMSVSRLKRIFSDCLVRNMNLMVNICPDRHGQVPPIIQARLVTFGQWVHAAAEAIYGTTGGPWQPVEGQYGFCYKDNIIYVYLLGGYQENTLVMPPVNKGMKVVGAYNVCTKDRIPVSQKGQQITLHKINPLKEDIMIIAVQLTKNVR
jgi:alpha-L-fucosidase